MQNVEQNGERKIVGTLAFQIDDQGNCSEALQGNFPLPVLNILLDKWKAKVVGQVLQLEQQAMAKKMQRSIVLPDGSPPPQI